MLYNKFLNLYNDLIIKSLVKNIEFSRNLNLKIENKLLSFHRFDINYMCTNMFQFFTIFIFFMIKYFEMK